MARISHKAHGGMALDVVFWVAMACLGLFVPPLFLDFPPLSIPFPFVLVEVGPA
jgi:hypothetical protein